jgi:tRNA-splicing ligase RtcB
MKYRDIGQPVIIPGDMSVGTYILVGLPGAMKESFGTTCHGAGRQMSRKATGSISARDVEADLSGRGITLRKGSDEGLVEEAPQAYKDVDTVVSVVCRSGLAGKVARLRPVGVVKG